MLESKFRRQNYFFALKLQYNRYNQAIKIFFHA